MFGSSAAASIDSMTGHSGSVWMLRPRSSSTTSVGVLAGAPSTIFVLRSKTRMLGCFKGAGFGVKAEKMMAMMAKSRMRLVTRAKLRVKEGF